MNILYIITGLGGGGAEKVVVDLADKMYSLGNNVKIAYLTGDVVVKPKNSEIELISLNLNNVTCFYSAFKNFNVILRTYKPAVIHSHMFHANIFSRISRLFFSIDKLICTAHSNYEGGRFRMLIYRMTHNLSDLITNVSFSASSAFEKKGAVPKGQIKTVYNGIDLNKFNFNLKEHNDLRAELKLEPNQKMLLSVGRLHHAKDYPNLLLAFAELCTMSSDKNPAKLFIVGAGELEELIIEQIGTLKLQDNVKLLGRRSDISSLMSAADLFVLSSSFEGFGLVVAEAMACNTFVVATDCGGVKEVMGGCGLLVPPKDSKALAQALQKALSISESEKTLNNFKALEHVHTNFDLNEIFKIWLELYEQ